VKLTWRSTLVLVVVVGLIAFFGAILVQKAWAQAKGPADFDYDGKGSGKVVFSHEKHSAKNPKCTDCHTKVFKMQKGVRTAFKMADMNNGQLCGTCHDGKAAFSAKDQATCNKCHLKG
jgi:c(7)-type cytochrome triheme protein